MLGGAQREHASNAHQRSAASMPPVQAKMQVPLAAHVALDPFPVVEEDADSAVDRVRAAVAVEAAVRRSELQAIGVGFVGKGQSGYPEHLAELPDAPDALFVRGDLPMTPGVAVVGTRRCTTYGKRLAAAYGRAIGEAGWCLVSGLARGIDGAAHEGTVASGARGVAVLGCGIDVSYPPEHAFLGRRLLDLGGAIVTEYPPGTPPEGWRFPRRNIGLSPVVWGCGLRFRIFA